MCLPYVPVEVAYRSPTWSSETKIWVGGATFTALACTALIIGIIAFLQKGCFAGMTKSPGIIMMSVGAPLFALSALCTFSERGFFNTFARLAPLKSKEEYKPLYDPDLVYQHDPADLDTEW